MAQNLIAEAWGVFVEITLVTVLFALYKDFKKSKDNRIVLRLIIEKHKNVLSLIEELKIFKDDEDKFLAFRQWARSVREDCDDIINNYSLIVDNKIGECIKKYKIQLEIINKAPIKEWIDIDDVIEKLNEQLSCMAEMLNEKSSVYMWDRQTILKIKKYTDDYKRFNK